jgi:hypothetical protein
MQGVRGKTTERQVRDQAHDLDLALRRSYQPNRPTYRLFDMTGLCVHASNSLGRVLDFLNSRRIRK